MIEIEGVSKRYGATTILHDVSLTIPQGGVTAIIGPNGAGKSTLLWLIGRLISANAGTIRVDGLDVARAPSRDLARRMAILRQDNAVLARISVRDLVAFGRFPHGARASTVEDRDVIDAAIAEMNLDALADRYLDELSGGQRQRAFIAMILAQDTRYLLLDEPLNSLDLQHVVAIMRKVRRIATDLGRTVVVVLHDLNVAAAFADRIVAMRDGTVAHDGPTAEVMQGETLSALYDTPIHVETVRGCHVVITEMQEGTRYIQQTHSS